MFKYVFKPLGMDAFKASTPNFWDAIAAGITGIAGIGSAAISSSTQKSANEAYLKGVRETNEANKELYHEQVKDNRVNAALQNAYNTPAAQLARLRQAGINTYGGDTGNSMQIASATPTAMKAPEQTPNPYGNLNLQGIASDVINTYRMSQDIQKGKMDLYRSGIENQFLAQEKANEIQMQMAEIAHKKVLTHQDAVRLVQLNKDLKYYDTFLEQKRQQNDETIRNMRKTYEEMDKRIIRDDKLCAAQCASLDANAAAVMINANSNAGLSKAQISKLVADVKRDAEALRQNKFKLDTDLMRYMLEKKIANMTIQEKEVYAKLLGSQLKMSDEKANSLVGSFIRDLTGTDISDWLRFGSTLGGAMILSK